MIFGAATLLTVGIGGTLATLFQLGYIGVASALPAATTPAVSREGMVAYPALGRPVKAFARITRDDFADPKTGQLNVLWMPKDKIADTWERDLGKLIGRVLARDKSANYILTEADFMPPGTREGIAGGVPPGKRAMVIDAKQVSGVGQLRPGDRFDLIASLPLNMQQLVPRVQWGLLQDHIDEREHAIGTLQKQASIKVLAHNAAIVAHERTASDKGKAEHFVTIAVDPVEISPLTEAIAINAGIVCIARSGHPDDPGADSRTPEHNPLEGVAFIENIRGQKRNLDVFLTKSEHHEERHTSALVQQTVSRAP